MKYAHVIPAIDLLDGRVVRLYQGKYSKVTYYNQWPMEIAKSLKREGHEWVHIVDLSAARCKTDKELQTYMASETRKRIHALLADIHVLGMKIELGGGIRDFSCVRLVKSGIVNRLSVGTKAFTDPDFYESLVQECGKDHVSLGLDLRDGHIAVHGWEDDCTVTWEDYLLQHKDSIGCIVCTDISKDGTMSGCNVSLYEKIIRFLKDNDMDCKLIASGGVVDTDLEKLWSIGVHEAIIGKALLERKFAK